VWKPAFIQRVLGEKGGFFWENACLFIQKKGKAGKFGIVGAAREQPLSYLAEITAGVANPSPYSKQHKRKNRSKLRGS
jgi:hypothetical protein